MDYVTGLGWIYGLAFLAGLVLHWQGRTEGPMPENKNTITIKYVATGKYSGHWQARRRDGQAGSGASAHAAFIDLTAREAAEHVQKEEEDDENNRAVLASAAYHRRVHFARGIDGMGRDEAGM